MKKLKVSVIMPVYNGEKYLTKAIDSILNQTFRDFELIVIEDGSTDSTSELLAAFKDKRIRVVCNKKNIGVTNSLNIGLRQAKGDYIARCDADEINHPKRFERQVNFLNHHSDVVLVGSSVILINQDNMVIGKVDFPQTHEEICRKIIVRNSIAHPTVMFRKKTIEQVGFYRSIFNGAEDYDLWFRMLHKGKVQNLPEYLVKRRIHDNVVTNKYHYKIELLALIIRICHLADYLKVNLI